MIPLGLYAFTRAEHYAKATGMPGDRVAQILAFPDCMASQGWIVVLMTGPPTNQTDYAAASQNCGQSRG